MNNLSRNNDSTKPSLGTFLLGFVFFVLPAAFVTAVAPVSYVTLEQRDASVAATTKQCLFFIIPYKTTTIHPLTAVSDRIRSSRQRTAEERRRNGGKNATIEGEAFLILTGPDDHSVNVPVSPASIQSVKERAQTFFATPTPQPLRMTVVANWKISVLVGGGLSSLTLLYIVGWLIVLLRAFFRLFSFSSPPGETLTFAEEPRRD